MPEQTLTLVLPAYNEEARLGSALDELFGYLPRRGAAGATARPGAERCRTSCASWWSTTGPRTARRTSCGRARSTPTGRLELLTVPHGGKGAAVRAGMLHATGDLVVFADADMATPPDELARWCGRSRPPMPPTAPGSSPTAPTCARRQPGWRRLLGKAFHLLASIWVVGPVQDTQCGFKGFRREVARDVFARQQITSIVFDVEVIYPCPQARLPPRGRAHPLGGPPRLAHAPRPAACAPASPGTCSGSR